MTYSGRLVRLLKRVGTAPPVTVRPFPFPYRAAVAISNDCEFMSWSDYLAMYRYLNHPEGLGLEVATSLFFFVTNATCHSSFGYFEDLGGAPATQAPVIREMVRAGYIDTIHAYGDFDAGGFNRAHAQAVAEECLRHDLRFPFWTNHGSDQNVQNLGHEALRVYQEGDDPASPHYHLDLLRQTGVEFFWVDDGYQEAVGEGTPLLYGQTARDGSRMRLVRRYRGLAGKPAPNAGSLAEQMTVDDLDLLVEREEACIYYQHLGVWAKTGPGEFAANRPPYFDVAGLHALEHLADLYHRGDCLVTTPGRLIRYLAMRDGLELDLSSAEIVLRSAAASLSAESLQGLTICISGGSRKVSWEDMSGRRHPLNTSVMNAPRAGTTTLSVPWSRLPEFAW
jgi:hypothetical protein